MQSTENRSQHQGTVTAQHHSTVRHRGQDSLGVLLGDVPIGGQIRCGCHVRGLTGTEGDCAQQTVEVAVRDEVLLIHLSERVRAELLPDIGHPEFVREHRGDIGGTRTPLTEDGDNGWMDIPRRADRGGTAVTGLDNAHTVGGHPVLTGDGILHAALVQLINDLAMGGGIEFVEQHDQQRQDREDCGGGTGGHADALDRRIGLFGSHGDIPETTDDGATEPTPRPCPHLRMNDRIE